MTTKTTTTPFRTSTILGFTFSIIVAIYMLPIWLIGFYINIAHPYEAGIGYFMLALMFIGVFFIPLLFLASLILAIVGRAKNAANKTFATPTFAILGGSLLLTILMFATMS